MDLTTLASGLLWIWFALTPLGAGLADSMPGALAEIRQPQSARFQVTASLGYGDERLAATGHGAFVLPDRFQASLEAQGQRYEQVVIGQTAYLRTPEEPTWHVVDARRAAEGELPGGSPFAPPSETSLPSEAAEAAAEILADTRLVGDELLGGAATRHYRLDVDLLALAARLGADADQLAEVETFQIGLDFWVGLEDRYLHQARLGLDLRSKGTRIAPAETVTGELTISLSDFDQPIRIESPLAAPRQAPVQAPRTAPVQLPRGG